MEIYAEGICKLSVCVKNGTDRSLIERLANARRPTGITSRWTISSESFADGNPNPCPCDHQCEDRVHYLLEC